MGLYNCTKFCYRCVRCYSSIMAKTQSEWNLRSYRYFLPIQTRIADMDLYNHVNNSVYHCYADTIINAYLVWYCGLSVNRSGPRQIGYMADTQCTYRRPASFPQSLLAGLQVAKVGKSSVHYKVGIFEPKHSYMGLTTSDKQDPHLKLGLGSQGLFISNENLSILPEIESLYLSEASVLAKSVHVFVDESTGKPVSSLTDTLSTGLNKVIDPNETNLSSNL